jgi:hypothetical protein
MSGLTRGLTRSNDRKTANAFRIAKNGKPVSTVANAFGLPSGKAFSCPGQTSICEQICYAGKIETIYPSAKALLMRNWNYLADADYTTMVELLTDMIADFIADTDKRKAMGDTVSGYDFRIHWDGDFFSETYADAWSWVVRAYPEVNFWVYTRSFTDDLNVIPVFWSLSEAAFPDNLTIYLSADSENVEQANKVAKEYPGVFIATLGENFREARSLSDDSRKGYDCPENRKALPLIGPKGSACTACGICLVGRGDVRFSRSKK